MSAAAAAMRPGRRRAFAAAAGAAAATGAGAAAWAYHNRRPMPSERERLRVFDDLAEEVLGKNARFSVGPSAAWRQKLLRQAHGDVLEVAVGCGGNFPFYSRLGVDSMTVTDVSQGMLDVSRRDAESGLGPIPLRCLRLDAEDLEGLQDGSFDTVVDTFGLCSFENPSRALAEMARVCRADGRVLLLEHGLSEWAPLRALQAMTREPWAWRFGCRHDLDLDGLIAASGKLEVLETKRWALGFCYMAVCRPLHSSSAPKPSRAE
eukprot:TRINITY_DN32973_c0_g1_i1.p1 TRINITY_DN32973_c0_g1~~TRINITY_DN32973_c0_g1_i1.p1  ORF type:complete len:288 (-),score=75.21 TRINITY_DN32973_c0_g1_i1:254-1042(-)